MRAKNQTSPVRCYQAMLYCQRIVGYFFFPPKDTSDCPQGPLGNTSGGKSVRSPEAITQSYGN